MKSIIRNKTVITTIDRMKILSKEEANIIQTIKPKVAKKTATKAEIMKLAKNATANCQKNYYSFTKR